MEYAALTSTLLNLTVIHCQQRAGNAINDVRLSNEGTKPFRRLAETPEKRGRRQACATLTTTCRC